ncbi:DUF7857 domain-containing protein [Halorussus salinus]|uniref:DUF7857 domain-containing protein n=1 Tax=Halorussus salinus TaxID=1364935 RepID=UPI001091D552|nr:hypothetical protein [Halorussus salinus]
MLELDSQVERRAGVALVTLVVRNPSDVPRRVRIADLLAGPIWPPRCEGVPAAGWDDGGFEGVVPARDRRALGYASPVDESDADAPRGPEVSHDSDALANPPAEIVWSERAGSSESRSETDPEEVAADGTPEGVVRSLGDPRPPADAVPTPDSPAAESSAADSSADSVSSVSESETDDAPVPDRPIPEPVEEWLSAVEERADARPGESGPGLRPADRAALGTVADRIDALRGRSGRSP